MSVHLFWSRCVSARASSSHARPTHAPLTGASIHSGLQGHCSPGLSAGHLAAAGVLCGLQPCVTRLCLLGVVHSQGHSLPEPAPWAALCRTRDMSSHGSSWRGPAHQPGTLKLLAIMKQNLSQLPPRGLGHAGLCNPCKPASPCHASMSAVQSLQRWVSVPAPDVPRPSISAHPGPRCPFPFLTSSDLRVSS